MNRTPIQSHEEVFTLEDDPEIMQLNFPPTEIEGTPEYTFLPADDKQLQYFVYPSNVSRRDYQFEIVEYCFHQNTLVCLPTGSGKTLIAAVVMMNFHRWYPKGKIVFMAPFRTLVTQQIDACMSLTDIKDEKVCILTGNTFTGNREEIWKQKSIFFCTPQIVQNDISKSILNPCSICLLIIDEAHHASGVYAYVNVVRMIAAFNSQFRVVGLSATPGSDIDKIQAVIYNLMISKIIYKDEDDIEISKYQHTTNVEIVKVPLGNDESNLENYLLQCITAFADPLAKRGYIKLSSSPKWLTRGIVWHAMDQFKKNYNQFHIPDFFKIMDNFGTLLSLSTMQEKLTKYGAAMLYDGIKDFIKKKKESECKKKLVSMPAFQQLQRDCETSKNVSHPKLAKLSEILGDFYSEGSDSRTIVFTKYRDAALAIAECLKKVKGVKASIFIGKSDTRKNHGLDETTQIEIISLFRHGNINCIVATSVAEEGLDIGEVDLIICYDTSSSPRTTVQRMGRTGRKRSGKVIFLMSEGYEEKNLEKAQYTRGLIKKKLTTAIENFILYKPENPVLPIPENCKAFNIACAKLDNETNILNKISDIDKKRNKNSEGNPEGTNPVSKSPFLSRTEITRLQCCYDNSLKYRNMEFAEDSFMHDHGCTIFSHSSENNILFAMKNNSMSIDIERQFDDIFKEVELQRKNQINTHKFKDSNSKNPFFIDSSEDSSEVSEDDDVEEINELSEKENTSPTTSPSFTPSSRLLQSSNFFLPPLPKAQPHPYISQTKQKDTPNSSRNLKNKKNPKLVKKQVQKQLFEGENNKAPEKNQIAMKFTPVRQLIKMKQTNLFSFAKPDDTPTENQRSQILEIKSRRFLNSDDENGDDELWINESGDEENNYSYEETNRREIKNNISSNTQIKSKNSFLSDDDDSDFEEILNQRDKLKARFNSSDEQAESECPDIIAVRRELGKKTTTKFLNDSEIDSFDIDEYFK